MTESWTQSPRELLRAGEDFSLADLDRRSTPGWEHGKKAARQAMVERGEELADLQEQLFAGGRTGDHRSVLVVMQGLDTSGKGGIVRHVLGMVDPQGVQIASFGVPTPEERSHHHLWRIWRQLPRAGRIGVFDRSHYEQVLVVKVDELEPPALNETRYDELVAFDHQVAESGTTVIKIALMCSYDEQTQRLASRLERPDKYWKYSPSDVDTRTKWGAYQEAFEEMFRRTSTDVAPWYVIPADRKWYARHSVTQILYESLKDLDLTWPEIDYDVEHEKQRLAATASPEGRRAAKRTEDQDDD